MLVALIPILLPGRPRPLHRNGGERGRCFYRKTTIFHLTHKLGFEITHGTLRGDMTFGSRAADEWEQAPEVVPRPWRRQRRYRRPPYIKHPVQPPYTQPLLVYPHISEETLITALSTQPYADRTIQEPAATRIASSRPRSPTKKKRPNATVAPHFCMSSPRGPTAQKAY